MIDLKNFIELSKYAGERFDLIQAGGGNSSVKLKNGEMIIKASGYLLSDISENNGYSKVLTKSTSNILKDDTVTLEKNKRKREEISKKLLYQSTLDKQNKPSIETLLHSFLYKYTLHTHPIVVNMIVVRKDWQDVLNSIFNDDLIALINYKTPGIDLAIELYNQLQTFDKIPKIIFLQNHGLIITSPNKKDIIKLTENVIDKIELFLKLDMQRFKFTNKISHLLDKVKKTNNISYLSEDFFINDQLKRNPQLFLTKPFCPDGFVFCGFSTVLINNILENKEIRKYLDKYHELPKVIIYNDKIFFIANNVKKAKEMEEVMKFNIMVLFENLKNEKNYLKDDELFYLNNWDAEKYRQNL